MIHTHISHARVFPTKCSHFFFSSTLCCLVGKNIAHTGKMCESNRKKKITSCSCQLNQRLSKLHGAKHYCTTKLLCGNKPAKSKWKNVGNVSVQLFTRTSFGVLWLRLLCQVIHKRIAMNIKLHCSQKFTICD